MPLNPMGNFSFNHIDQQDDLYKTKTAAEIKQLFDSRGNELKTALNALITALQSTTTDNSGAENIGIQSITGVTGSNVQSALEDLRLQINAAVAGTIPNGSITEDKLAFDIATDAASVSIVDSGNKFTATNVEEALDELFTSANSVKTNVSGAIGSPATVNDTGSQLAGYITTEKGRIVSEVGDGSSADSLKYLIDRLIVRSDAIATAINAKGVASTSADTLAQLATKIGLISTGKKFASGTATSTSNGALTISGLNFTPSIVIARVSGSTKQSTALKFGSSALNNTGDISFSATNNGTVTDVNKMNFTASGFTIFDFTLLVNTLHTWLAIE
jgi:hypothetical protein